MGAAVVGADFLAAGMIKWDVGSSRERKMSGLSRLEVEALLT